MSRLTAIQQAMATAFPGAARETDYSKKGYMLDVAVPPERILEAVGLVDAQGFFIETITGVDWLGEKAAIRKEAADKAAAAAAAKAKAQAAKAAKAAEAAAAAGDDAAAAEPAPEGCSADQEEPAPAKADAAPAQDDSAGDDMEVVYDFNHYAELCRVVIRSRVPRNKPEISTISEIYPAAHWHERETHDFFGITFVGHPYLVPLLLPEDADFHPLLKDFNT